MTQRRTRSLTGLLSSVHCCRLTPASHGERVDLYPCRVALCPFFGLARGLEGASVVLLALRGQAHVEVGSGHVVVEGGMDRMVRVT
jgi:hypothetical protein